MLKLCLAQVIAILDYWSFLFPSFKSMLLKHDEAQYQGIILLIGASKYIKVNYLKAKFVITLQMHSCNDEMSTSKMSVRSDAFVKIDN